MKLTVQFEVEPVLLVTNDLFSNKSMLNGSQLLFLGSQAPEDMTEEDNEDKCLDWFCEQICEVLEHDEVPFLVIQQNLLPLYKNSGIRLITHVRLSKNEKLNQLPIIVLTHRGTDTPKSQQEWEVLAPLYSKGVRFIPEQDKERKYVKNESLLIQDIEKLYADLIKDGKSEVDLSQFTDYDSPAVPVSKPEGTNHQLTNDWGAYRLIQAAGLIPTYKYREHLYFKYLQRSSVEPYPVSKDTFREKLNQNLRILLIDDNFQKGWKSSIEDILNKCLLNKGYKAIVEPIEYADSISPLLEDKNGVRLIDNYDLVYLDLRLPANKTNRSNPLAEQGIRTLNAIKKANVSIPIIMFTSSTKATNMDDLYELGVDGYFVKEFPETRNNSDFSKNSLEGFIKTTRNCLKKGALLRPYWNRIREISKNNLIRGNERLLMGKRTRFEDRIIERLTMFIGLLKKAYEQTTFDRDTFLYDHYETAFLTLWSCLNDLSDFYFDKDQPLVTLANGTQRPYTNDPNKKHFRWRLEGKTFVEYDYDQLRGKEQKSSLYYNPGGPVKYKIGLFKSTPVNFERILHSQVAFIALTKFNADKDKPLLNMIFDSNEIRNQLVLTHSSDSAANNTSKTLRELREQSSLDAKALNQLFIIVYLLSKGKRIATI